MEAAGLGLFMVSACFFGTLLEHPASPLHQAIPIPWLRRLMMGALMGLTAIGIIYSLWGQQSGAHLNPSVTLTFFRLGKVATWDALWYIVAQCAGGLAGVLLSVAGLGYALAAPSVNYVATVPGTAGTGVAFIAEAGMTFVLMTVILTASNTPRLARYTGLFAGMLVASYITLEAPLSGMSMNPARTFASALQAQQWTAFWIDCTAPLLGMLLAAELYLQRHGIQRVLCAKLHHTNTKRCTFSHCGFQQHRTTIAAETARHSRV